MEQALRIAKNQLINLLKDAGIVLDPDDMIVGGVVRDILLGKEFGDIDVYSPTRQGSNVTFLPQYWDRVNVKFTDKTHGGIEYMNAVYKMGGLTIDHKFYPQSGLMACEDVEHLFMASICQCAYSPMEGVYVSKAFLKTIQNKTVTFDRAVPNWNETDGRGANHHRDKLMAKFPDYTFDKLPAAKDTVNKTNTSRLPTSDEVYESEKNKRAYAAYVNGDDDDYGS